VVAAVVVVAVDVDTERHVTTEFTEDTESVTNRNQQ